MKGDPRKHPDSPPCSPSYKSFFQRCEPALRRRRSQAAPPRGTDGSSALLRKAVLCPLGLGGAGDVPRWPRQPLLCLHWRWALDAWQELPESP